MALTIVQIILSIIAGLGLFLMWGRVAAAGRAVAWFVTAGVLVRAIGGQVAFWISYLHLPFARSLQLGDGFWIFGLDGQTYFQEAAAAARSGPMGILLVSRGASSPFYEQILATMILLFGAIASTALLLNIAAYLGCCLVALSFGAPAEDRVVVFCIAALSLAPSAVMWSIQPMKDTWFIFLVALFFGSARVWQQDWSSGNGSRRAVWAMLAMLATLYGISGMRWYFGFIAAVACLPFFALTILRTPRRAAAIAIATALVPLLFAAVVLGSGPYISGIIDTSRHSQGNPVLALPRALFKYVHDARSGFDRLGGATLIGAGYAIREVDEKLGDQEVRVAASRADEPAAAPDPRTAPAGSAIGIVTPAPGSKPAAVAPTPGSAQVAAAAPPLAVAPRHAIAPKSVLAESRSALERGAPTRTVSLPASHVARILAGTAAMILPRAIAQRLGIFDIRGGRGLWFFAEIDTIVFDVVGIFCLVSLIGSIRRREIYDPVFWLILMVTTVMGASLAYTVSNFGTLFRHREMVLLGLVMLPLAAFSAKGSRAGLSAKETRDVVGDLPNAVPDV